MVSNSELKATSPTGNIYLDTLTADQAFVSGTLLTYVLQGNGLYGGTTWSLNGARDAFSAALSSWSSVADISFSEAAGPYNGTGSTADYDWIESFGSLPLELAGRHDLPHAGTMLGSYSNAPGLFTARNLAAGGLGLATFVHEIGHGLGLLHPHESRQGPSGYLAFPGVSDPFDVGDNGLNQGIYTVMTYNPGFEEVGLSTSAEFGWETGPMAFDIAAVQAIYGPNLSTNAGDDFYFLPTGNRSGTGWSTIWDAGGTDTISANTTDRGVIIDLREATLLNEPGGGGFVSRQTGVIGGLTIANGVLIENARGGRGDDHIRGNFADNDLDGSRGYDTVDYSGIAADLTIDLVQGIATGDGSDVLTSIEAAIGGDGADRITAFAGYEVARGSLVLFKTEDQDIDSRERALDLDYRFGSYDDFDQSLSVPANSGQASITIRGEGGFGADYYSFTAEQAGPILIDVDDTFAFDSRVRVYDGEGNLVASNDDGDSLDMGSASILDSFLIVEDFDPGERLFVELTGYGSSYVGRESSYELNISLYTSRVAEGTTRIGSRLWGGLGDDTLVGGAGDDTLDGGPGNDTAVFLGASSEYAATSSGQRGDTLVLASAIGGTDTLRNVEFLEFADGLYVWSEHEGSLIRHNVGPSFQSFPTLQVAKGSTVQFKIAGSDPDGDPLTYVLANPYGGSVVVDETGLCTFELDPDFTGIAQFAIILWDDHGHSADQVVRMIVPSIGHAPPDLVNGFRTSESGSVTFDAAALAGPGGMPSVITAGEPGNGSVTINRDDTITYTPFAGFRGYDSLFYTVWDEQGGTASARATIAVDPEPVRLVLSEGFVGAAGGAGEIFGTNGFQDLSLVGMPDDLAFDGSFARGGDVLRFSGDAADYTAAVDARLHLTNGASTYTIPVGTAGTYLVFDDGVRVLRYDAEAGTVMLGTQAIDGTPATITAPGDGSALPAGADPEAAARLILFNGSEGSVEGTYSVFGTNGGTETVHYRGGYIDLDGSFARGGDEVVLDRGAEHYSAYLSGTSLVLVAPEGELAMPMGVAGMDLVFAGETRTLVFDPSSQQVAVGGEIITAVEAGNAQTLASEAFV